MAAAAIRIVASRSNPEERKRAPRGRSSNADLLASIVESSNDAIISKDLDGFVISWNAAAERIFGYCPEEAVGRHITLVIPPELHFQETEILARIRTGERIEHYETVRQCKDGTLIDVSLTISPIKNVEGEIVGASKIARDISQQKRNERLIAQYQSRFELLHKLGKALTADLNLSRIVDETIAVATRATGAQFGAFFYYSAPDDKGERNLLYALAGAEREAFTKLATPRNSEVLNPAFTGAGIVRSDDIRKDPRYGRNAPHLGQPSGYPPVVSYLAVPVRSHTGEVLGGLFFGHEKSAVFDEEAEAVAREIATVAGLMVDNAQLYEETGREAARRKAAEETKELLLHEIKHRVKNLLATVEIIAKQSLHDVPVDVRRAFIARMRAVAGVHDLLTEHDWRVVNLGDTIAKGLQPFASSIRERVSASGPDIKLEPNKSLMMALVVHELGMNAMKHGALSNEEGRILISWDVSQRNELQLLWQEIGGPPVTPPRRHGFGSILVERALRGSGGYAELKFEPGGVICAIMMKI